jgi:sterol 14alpha-demethylase
MGLVAEVSAPFERLIAALPVWQLVLLGFASFVFVSVCYNILRQWLFYDRNAPPEVFSFFPVLGSTIRYGIDPFDFFFDCKKKYGDVFTFVLLGKKVTVCLGTKGNEFILNSKLKDVNAEEIYTGLTTPVFGTDVVYDCPNAKLMEQKKFVKFGLTMDAFKSYVSLICSEVDWFVANSPKFAGNSGTIDIPRAMAELTIYTASRSLQGKEVRQKFDSTFADLYHDLDMGFAPINFMLPWAPLPHNRARDRAQKKMAETYMEIIRARRAAGGKKEGDEEDMIWNLMGCVYKNGTPVPDKEVAHMMIALLMAGQHSSSSTISWIMLRLASRPDIMEELLQEQKDVLGEDLPPLTYEALQKLTLNAKVVKETLRIHAPIHSILRKVKSPLTIIGSTETESREYQIPTTHCLMSAPGVTSRQQHYFPEPLVWEPHRWEEGHPLAYTGGNDKEEFEDYGYGMVSKGASSPYLPFGAGRHRCIGEQFAYVQLGTILGMMTRLIKVKNMEGRDGKMKTDVVGTDYSSLFSRPLAPAVVRWEKREADKGEKGKSNGHA